MGIGIGIGIAMGAGGVGLCINAIKTTVAAAPHDLSCMLLRPIFDEIALARGVTPAGARVLCDRSR